MITTNLIVLFKLLQRSCNRLTKQIWLLFNQSTISKRPQSTNTRVTGYMLDKKKLDQDWQKVDHDLWLGLIDYLKQKNE